MYLWGFAFRCPSRRTPKIRGATPKITAYYGAKISVPPVRAYRKFVNRHRNVDFAQCFVGWRSMYLSVSGWHKLSERSWGQAQDFTVSSGALAQPEFPSRAAVFWFMFHGLRRRGCFLSASLVPDDSGRNVALGRSESLPQDAI